MFCSWYQWCCFLTCFITESVDWKKKPAADEVKCVRVSLCIDNVCQWTPCCRLCFREIIVRCFQEKRLIILRVHSKESLLAKTVADIRMEGWTARCTQCVKLDHRNCRFIIVNLRKCFIKISFTKTKRIPKFILFSSFLCFFCELTRKPMSHSYRK